MMWLGLLLGVLGTSFISGFLGMGGGMLLMGIYGGLLPISSAMILHGITQFTANGSRSYFLRKNIRWEVIFPYGVGALLSGGAFFFIAYIPSKPLVFIGLGLLPFLTLITPKLEKLNILKPHISFLCGLSVVSCQLFIGVSGGLLDLFFVKSKLNRYEIVATKAITQTCGHFIKLLYYSYLIIQITGEIPLPFWIYPMVIGLAMIGTHLGKQLLQKINEDTFRFITQWGVLLIGIVYLYKGSKMLL